MREREKERRRRRKGGGERDTLPDTLRLGSRFSSSQTWHAPRLDLGFHLSTHVVHRHPTSNDAWNDSVSVHKERRSVCKENDKTKNKGRARN